MEREQVLEQVERQAGLDSREAAATAVDATLRTLGERITLGEARDVASLLPAAFAEALTDEGDESPEDFPVDEFVRRVREREREAGVDGDDVERHVRAVMYALAASGARNELQETREQLPNEYAALFDTDGLEAA